MGLRFVFLNILAILINPSILVLIKFFHFLAWRCTNKNKKVKSQKFTLVELCRFFIISGIAFVISLVTICEMGLRMNSEQNLRVAEVVAKVYWEGRSKGVDWDTSSEVALARDVIQGRFCSEGAFKGNFFGVEVNSFDPDPAQVADYLILNRDDERIYVFDTTQ
jgi:5-methylcytosine-specific restriction endonuclease McrA